MENRLIITQSLNDLINQKISVGERTYNFNEYIENEVISEFPKYSHRMRNAVFEGTKIIDKFLESLTNEFNNLENEKKQEISEYIESIKRQFEEYKTNKNSELQEFLEQKQIQLDKLKKDNEDTLSYIEEKKEDFDAMLNSARATDENVGLISKNEIKELVKENVPTLSFEEYVDLIAVEKQDTSVDYDILEILKGSVENTEKFSKLEKVLKLELETEINKVLADETCVNFIIENYFMQILSFYLSNDVVESCILASDLFKIKFTESTLNNAEKISTVIECLEAQKIKMSQRTRGEWMSLKSGYKELNNQAKDYLISELVLEKNGYDNSTWEISYGEHKITTNVFDNRNAWLIGLKGIVFKRVDRSNWVFYSYKAIEKKELKDGWNLLVHRSGDVYNYEIFN